MQHAQRVAGMRKQPGGVQPVRRAGELVDPWRAKGVPEGFHPEQRFLCKTLVFRQRVPCAVLCHGAAVAKHQLRAGALCTCQKCFQQVRRNRVIAVHHRDPGRRCGIQPRIACAGRTRAGLGRVQRMDAGVFFCPRIAHLRAAVRAGIVNEQQLKVGKGLGEYALHTGVQRFFRLVDRHKYADCGHVPLLSRPRRADGSGCPCSRWRPPDATAQYRYRS